MKYIIRAVPYKDRMLNLDILRFELRDPIILMDDFNFLPYLTSKERCGRAFARAFACMGFEAAVHLEDDVLLCDNFRKKIEAVIAERPNEVIQFFSMRKEDKTIGSRYSRKFIMGQCFYLPAGYGELINEFVRTGTRTLRETYELEDMIIHEFLKSRKEKFWIHCPSLVQHLPMRSASNARRSTKRQSATFQI